MNQEPPLAMVGESLGLSRREDVNVKAHIPAIEQLDRLLDSFLIYGATTTSIIQSSPVPLRPPPLPEKAVLE